MHLKYVWNIQLNFIFKKLAYFFIFVSVFQCYFFKFTFSISLSINYYIMSDQERKPILNQRNAKYFSSLILVPKFILDFLVTVQSDSRLFGYCYFSSCVTQNPVKEKALGEVSYHHRKDNSSSWDFDYPQKTKTAHLNNCEEMDFPEWYMP